MQEDQKDTIENILETYGVEFGSRALDVHQEHSDYDYAVLSEHLEDFCFSHCNAENYFKVLPENDYEVALKIPFKDSSVDIIILDKAEDLEVVSKAINDLKSIPKYLLQDKLFRIDAYEKALIFYGWVDKDNTFENEDEPPF